MKGKQMSKSLKVVSINKFGDEAEMLHGIGEVIPEEMYVVAILKGVTNAGSTIKSFEVVEV
jgi:hypothetical protein